MREIKFRAWYKPTAQMVQTKEIERINFEVKTIGAYISIDDRGFNVLRMDNFELMQFTGLKDRNGKEIYEGDVLNIGGRSKVIEWCDLSAQWAVRNPVTGIGQLDINIDLHEYEIIGNIYEHPHLLKEYAHR